jgi:hypothetical protein
MTNVIGFDLAKGKDKTEFTLIGPAVCTNCKHQWQAVTPVGHHDNLKCPECSLFMGIVGAPVVPEKFWLCRCGSDLFYLTPSGAGCRSCGLVSSEWAE